MNHYDTVPDNEDDLHETTGVTIPNTRHARGDSGSIRSNHSASDSMAVSLVDTFEDKDVVRPGTASNNAALYHVM